MGIFSNRTSNTLLHHVQIDSMLITSSKLFLYPAVLWSSGLEIQQSKKKFYAWDFKASKLTQARV